MDDRLINSNVYNISIRNRDISSAICDLKNIQLKYKYVTKRAATT